jgi:hypothetical protein
MTSSEYQIGLFNLGNIQSRILKTISEIYGLANELRSSHNRGRELMIVHTLDYEIYILSCLKTSLKRLAIVRPYFILV